MDFSQKASKEAIERAVAALTNNGFTVVVVENEADAKKAVFDRIPEGAEVMNMTSVTLEQIGVVSEVLSSPKINAVRKQFADETVSAKTKRQLGAAPDIALGSVHAITEDGSLLIASNTGSQLPAYAYGAERVIWVVGAQKIVPDFATGMKRIYEHTLPLESERAKKAYGAPGSFVSKLLVINREVAPGRATVIIINEAIGY